MPQQNQPGGASSVSGTVQSQVQMWLQHITQYFKGNYSGSGENGIDIGIVNGTPVYAVSSGPVIGMGYYGGGGVVAIASNISYGGINGIASIYYQHLDTISVKKGQQITAGQQIGTSGGQLSGGSHPSTRTYSTGPHIEIGINAPFGHNSIWANRGPNVNPLGFFQAIANGNAASVLPGGDGYATLQSSGVNASSGPSGITSTSSGGKLFAAGQIAANAATEPYLALGQASSKLLEQMPGLDGIIYALDASEQFPGIATEFDITNVFGSIFYDVAATIIGNSKPFFVRGLFMVLGLWFLIVLVLAAVAENPGIVKIAATAAEAA